MNFDIDIDEKIKFQFPDLIVLAFTMAEIKVENKNYELERVKESLFTEVKSKYDLQSLKDIQIFRLYRDFFWKINIDPTKIRPASEALIRRILLNKKFPTINTFVDAYNLASIKSEISLAAFDKSKVNDRFKMRFARKGEKFVGIGMQKKSFILKGKEIVISDMERIVALYPYRDADHSKISNETKNVSLLVCGVPGISLKKLEFAKEMAIKFISRFCQ